MDFRWDGIPDDIFLNILHRLPPLPRRRLRLVCQHWCDVIDEHTSCPQADTKVLPFVGGGNQRRRSRAYGFGDLPEDVLVDILHRLPPFPRRRLRLVCRHWRNVIDYHTPCPRAGAKVLAFVVGGELADGELRYSRAYVFGDLTSEWLCPDGRDLKLRWGAVAPGSSMVGACNGLLCLRRDGGDVVVLNPVTGEKLVVPPPPRTPEVPFKDAAAYSFAYHPETGEYKIVHVPCHGDDYGRPFDAVSVFTLGRDASWRVVPVRRGSTCLLSFGVVSAGGATYWVAKDARSVMAFDLKDERLVLATTLPVRVHQCLGHYSWHLTTDLRGRLGFAVVSHETKRTRTRTLKASKTEVWVLEDGGRGRDDKKQRAWVLLHTVVEPGRHTLQEIAWPHLTHGEHVLTTQQAGDGESWVSLHAYRLSEAATTTHGGVEQMECTPPLMIGRYKNRSSLRTFAYVETREPVALYAFGGSEVGNNPEWSWVFHSGEMGWKLHCLSWMDISPES